MLKKLLSWLKWLKELGETLLKLRTIWLALFGLVFGAGGYYSNSVINEKPVEPQIEKPTIRKVDKEMQELLQGIICKYHYEDCK